MTTLNTVSTVPSFNRLFGVARRLDPVLASLAALVLLIALYDSSQAGMSLNFMSQALIGISPVLLVSVALAAAARASGADALVSHAFSGRQIRSVLVAAIIGALSPLCSCGVIPLVASLLAGGVPLAPVMAFWLSSPIMDPAMFVLTAGTLGIEFALAKTVAAILLGVSGGLITMALGRTATVQVPLKGGVGGTLGTDTHEIIWHFWRAPVRAQRFLIDLTGGGWRLLRWMALAFVLESLLLAYVPPAAVAHALGGNAVAAIPLAVLV